MEGGAWSIEESGYDEGKFRTAVAMACSFLQFPDQEKALTGFLKEVIFSSSRPKSV